MRAIIVLLVVLVGAPFASAHHSATAFFDRTTMAEVEGTVTDIFWRNPHVFLTLEVVGEDGVIENWELEAGTTNTLMRRGFTADSVSIGDQIKAAGSPSRRGEPAIFVSNLLLPDGTEVIASDRDAALRWTTEGNPIGDVYTTDDLSGLGIFKVWGFRELYRLRNPLVLTPTAQAVKAAFNPRTDDPGLSCIPPGMPNAVLNPYPMEFIEEDGRIVQRIEEWDATRIIHMTEGGLTQDYQPDHLGYSVGKFEANTLIVETTQVNFSLLDGDGTPMGPNAKILERYTLSEDETRLLYEVIVEDSDNLLEPAIWENVWVHRPGVMVMPFGCTLRDTVSPVYQ